MSASNKSYNLTQKTFLSQGGEGKVHRIGKEAFKIYDDPKATIKQKKIDQLSVIKRPNITAPKELVFKGKKPIGFIMPFVPNTVPICQLFAKSFVSRNNISPEQLTTLVRKIQESVSFIHSNNILIVDLNEVNILVNNKQFNIPYFIDVDSYQTPSFPATAIMTNVADVHNQEFSTGTDWFAWAITTFQLLIGIHPYKGKHPKIKTVGERMKHNISVFNQDVRLPKVCNPLDSIPQALRAWYYDVFENGARTEPPTNYSNLILTTGHIKYNYDLLNNLEATQIVNCDWDILDYVPSTSSKFCVVSDKGLYISTGKTKKYQKFKAGAKITPKVISHDNIMIAATILNGRVALYNASTKRRLKHDPINAEDILVYGNRFYVKYEERVYRIDFLGKYPHYIVCFNPVTMVMANASRIFSGVIIQDIGGDIHATTFPEKNKTYQYQLKALNSYKIINAKFDRGLLVVVGFKNNKYDRFLFRLKDGKIIHELSAKDVNYNGINFAVLDSGVCVLMNEHKEIEAFCIDSLKSIKLIKDDYLNGRMRLISDGNSIYFADGKELYKLKMKG